MLEAGENVPSISVDNQNGETVTLDFTDPTVLYFYPKDNSPGCTIETRQFNNELEKYADAGIDIFGVSTDDVESHNQFCSKYELEFDLLADPNGDMASAFGVDTTGGRADRVTYILNNQEVTNVYQNVEPDGHAREIIADLVRMGLATPE